MEKRPQKTSAQLDSIGGTCKLPITALIKVMGGSYISQTTCLHQIWKVYEHKPLLIFTNFLKLLTERFNTLPVIKHMENPALEVRSSGNATSQPDINRSVFSFFFQRTHEGKHSFQSCSRAVSQPNFHTWCIQS